MRVLQYAFSMAGIASWLYANPPATLSVRFAVFGVIGTVLMQLAGAAMAERNIEEKSS